MHLHILGICGTFMGGIAAIARSAGFKVTGSDRNIYPPMSTELEKAGIDIIEGYEAQQLDLKPDLVVVGNVMKRGMPVVERLLNENMPYLSGPQWLYEHCLKHKRVLCVCGTHGKTTTSAMLAYILEKCGKNPGFLIGGVTESLGGSAKFTDSDFFVIEGDEYDCAFFDKRAKFVHYHPEVAVLNNLEYDHADIYDDLRSIQRQFHHLVRTIPSKGAVIVPESCESLDEVLRMGLWSKEVRTGGVSGLHVKPLKAGGEAYELYYGSDFIGSVANQGPMGLHNLHNLVMAAAAAHEVGIEYHDALKALASFTFPKRRMELKGEVNGIKVYDDFAHHPTAVRLTTEALRAHVGRGEKIIVVFEPRSNSMKAGVNAQLLPHAFDAADWVFVYAHKSVSFDVKKALDGCKIPFEVEDCFDTLVAKVIDKAQSRASILCMSNGSFNGIHARLLEELRTR